MTSDSSRSFWSIRQAGERTNKKQEDQPAAGPYLSGIGGNCGVRQAILPPPFFVTTTMDGRGGMSGLKSGQRVAGFS